MGVPAIVSDACAARDFISPDESGVLFRSGDVDDLARQITHLAETPGLAGKLGEGAYRSFWSHPATLETHIEKLLKIYEDIQQRSRQV